MRPRMYIQALQILSSHELLKTQRIRPPTVFTCISIALWRLCKSGCYFWGLDSLSACDLALDSVRDYSVVSMVTRGKFAGIEAIVVLKGRISDLLRVLRGKSIEQDTLFQFDVRKRRSHMWLASIVLILAAISFALALKQQREDKAVLRHTIRVNLGILRGELDALSSLTAVCARAPETDEKTAETSADGSAISSTDRNKAKALLALSRALGDEAEDELESASEKLLGRKLSLVFQAMDLSLRARRLLKAIHPAVNVE